MDHSTLLENLISNAFVMSNPAPSILDVAAVSGALAAAKYAVLSDWQVADILFPLVYKDVHATHKYRSSPTGRRYGLDPALIADAMEGNKGFFVQLGERSWSKPDPVELAAWVEYEIGDRICPYPYASGRMARSFSAWTLFKRAAPLPVYRDRKAYFTAMGSDWPTFLRYYRTCFPV